MGSYVATNNGPLCSCGFEFPQQLASTTFSSFGLLTIWLKLCLDDSVGGAVDLQKKCVPGAGRIHLGGCFRNHQVDVC